MNDENRLRFYAWMMMALIFIVFTSMAYSLEVTYVIGDVKLQRESRIIPLTVETKLISGDTIITGKKSLCTLKYADGSVVEIRADSKIAVGNDNIKGTNYVSLISGVVYGKFVKIQKSGGINKIYTPTTTCAVRGTEFTIASAATGESRVKLEEGKLEIRNPFGKMSIEEGKSAEVGIAEKPLMVENEEDFTSWNERKNELFERAPEEYASKYEIYIQKLDSNTKRHSRQISDLEKNLTRNSIKGKEVLEKNNKKIDMLAEDLMDESFLNENAQRAIGEIIENIVQEKLMLKNKFLEVKEKFNKVREQQKRIYEALQAVKEAYQKAYEAIVKKHRDTLKIIKGQ